MVLCIQPPLKKTRPERGNILRYEALDYWEILLRRRDNFKSFKGGEKAVQGLDKESYIFQGFKGFFKGLKKFKGVSRVSRNSRVAGHHELWLALFCNIRDTTEKLSLLAGKIFCFIKHFVFTGGSMTIVLPNPPLFSIGILWKTNYLELCLPLLTFITPNEINKIRLLS